MIIEMYPSNKYEKARKRKKNVDDVIIIVII